MTDRTAEKGAIQYAIENPSAPVSRIGAAGYIQGVANDLATGRLTATTSTLAGRGALIAKIANSPSLLFDFTDSATAKIGSATLTYTGSNGTYFNSSGTLTAATTNVPRLDYNPSTLIARGLLIEEARTNTLLRSEGFDNGVWGKIDTTITANSINAPTGTQIADLATEGSAGTAQVQQDYTATANTTQQFSLFVKAGNLTWVRLFIFEVAASANAVSGWFNVATGAVGSVANGGTGTGAAISIQNVGNGWYRCTLGGAVNNAATALSAAVSSASADASTTRVNGATYYPFGAQVENNAAFATSYIATVGAAVTRAADIASITGASFSSFWNATQGTIVANVAISSANLVSKDVYSVSDGGSNNRIVTRAQNGAGQIVSVVRSGAATVATLTSTVSGSTTSRKIATAYALDNYAISVSGETPVTDTSGALPVLLSQINIGSLEDGTEYLNGWISSLAYYTTRKTDSQLQALST